MLAIDVHKVKCFWSSKVLPAIPFVHVSYRRAFYVYWPHSGKCRRWLVQCARWACMRAKCDMHVFSLNRLTRIHKYNMRDVNIWYGMWMWVPLCDMYCWSAFACVYVWLMVVVQRLTFKKLLYTVRVRVLQWMMNNNYACITTFSVCQTFFDSQQKSQITFNVFHNERKICGIHINCSVFTLYSILFSELSIWNLYHINAYVMLFHQLQRHQ